MVVDSGDNLIVNEIHQITTSRGVFPLKQSFYDEPDTLKVEGSVDGVSYTKLDSGIDFFFSPMWIDESARTGVFAYAYLVILGEWTHIRLSYEFAEPEVTDGVSYLRTDNELKTQVANMTFDRMDVEGWYSVLGTESYNPRSRNPLIAKKAEIEILNDGLSRIVTALGAGVVGESTVYASVAELDTLEAIVNTKGNVTSGMLNARTMVYDTVADSIAESDTYVIDISSLSSTLLSCEVWYVNSSGNYQKDDTPVAVIDTIAETITITLTASAHIRAFITLNSGL